MRPVSFVRPHTSCTDTPTLPHRWLLPVRGGLCRASPSRGDPADSRFPVLKVCARLPAGPHAQPQHDLDGLLRRRRPQEVCRRLLLRQGRARAHDARRRHRRAGPRAHQQVAAEDGRRRRPRLDGPQAKGQDPRQGHRQRGAARTHVRHGRRPCQRRGASTVLSTASLPLPR